MARDSPDTLHVQLGEEITPAVRGSAFLKPSRSPAQTALRIVKAERRSAQDFFTLRAIAAISSSCFFSPSGEAQQIKSTAFSGFTFSTIS